MAFPPIPTAASGDLQSSRTTVASTTHTMPNQSSLRGGAGPQSGDLLIALIVQYACTGNNATFTWPAGWTEFPTNGDQGSTTGPTVAIGVAYRIATGSESGTFNVTSAGTGYISAQALMRIPAGTWHGTTIPDVSTAAFASGAAPDIASFDPPNIDTEDTLWIAFCGYGETTTTGSPPDVTASPSGYGGDLVIARGTDAVGAVAACVGFLQANAASEDPGTFTVANPTRGRGGALLVAVRPALIPPSVNLVAATAAWSGSTLTVTPGAVTASLEAATAAWSASTLTETHPPPPVAADLVAPTPAWSASVLTAETGATAFYTDPQGHDYFLDGDATLVAAGGGDVQHVNIGTAGKVWTPDHADFDITGDLDMRILVQPDDWTPTGALALCSKYDGAGADHYGWYWNVQNDGRLDLLWDPSGDDTNPDSRAQLVDILNPTGRTDGEHLWLRVTVDVDNGSGDFTPTIYGSTDPKETDPADVSWSLLFGGTRHLGGPDEVTAFAAVTAPLNLGGFDYAPDTNLDPLGGNLYYFEIRAGIDGTIRSAADFRGAFAQTASLAAPTSVWSASALTVTVGARQADIAPAFAAWTADPLTVGVGAFARNAVAATASWSASALDPSVAAAPATDVTLAPASCAWSASAQTVTTARLFDATPAVTSWSASTLAPATGARGLDLEPVATTWAAQALTTTTGGVSVDLAPAAATFTASTVTNTVGGVLVTLAPAASHFDATTLTTSVGVSTLDLSPASATWEAATLDWDLAGGPVTRSITPASSSWAASQLSRAPGARTVGVAASTTSWSASPLVPSVGAFAVTCAPADTNFTASVLTGSTSAAPVSVEVVPGTTSWTPQALAAAAGAAAVTLTPAETTWVATILAVTVGAGAPGVLDAAEAAWQATELDPEVETLEVVVTGPPAGRVLGRPRAGPRRFPILRRP